MATNEQVTGNDSVAIIGTASAGERTLGIRGQGDSTGVQGVGKAWNGVEGISRSTIGGAGVFGANDTGVGVRGESRATYNPAIQGIHRGEGGSGVQGEAEKGTGVVGISKSWIGVYGESDGGAVGVMGEGKATGDGVKGHASGPGKAAVCGFHLTNQGPGVFGKGAPAGRFEGDVEVTGDIRLLNADCAEDFDIAGLEAIEPGTVMVLGEEGALMPSDRAYDKRVAGVISGAGWYKPGIVLDKQPSRGNRSPIGLLGKVFCKVDAGPAPVEVGDLLTTSDTPGHAMKAGDSAKAFGSVIGKALRPLAEGRGLIPILIALQ
jgi:hypothetical protein